MRMPSLSAFLLPPAPSVAHRIVPVLLGALLVGAANPVAPQEAEPETPGTRLIVLVVVDQMIPQQLERLRPWLGGGFGRFLDRGQVWMRGAHRHGSTETGPGHATLGTGLHPKRHGIVGNSWVSAEEGGVYCCGDDQALIVTSDGPMDGGGGRSPANLLVPGMADHTRAAAPGSKSIGISGKDRAAILSTGQRADWALWWDRGGNGFVSSTWYGQELPAWVVEFDETWPASMAVEDGYLWESSLPAGASARGTAADERPGEAGLGGGVTFPHRAPRVAAGSPTAEERSNLARWAFSTPLIDHFVLELAKRAVVAMELGADDQADYLFVGLSACDTVGHVFGPYSHETTDVLLRADRELEELFALLDERVGEGRWLAALSGDHGVLELPESLAEQGFDARRVSWRDVASALGALRQELVDLHGVDFVRHLDPGGALLDREAARTAGVDPADLEHELAGLALEHMPWLAHAYPSDELLAPDSADDPLRSVVARSYAEGRSPHVVFVARPWTLVGSAAGTTHGSPYDYDRAVPVAFYGPGCARELRYDPCATVDVVPTLLRRAGLAVPDGLDGRVLP